MWWAWHGLGICSARVFAIFSSCLQHQRWTTPNHHRWPRRLHYRRHRLLYKLRRLFLIQIWAILWSWILLQPKSENFLRCNSAKTSTNHHQISWLRLVLLKMEISFQFAYQRVCIKDGVALCQQALIGRVFLLKGEKPWKLTELRDKLQQMWKISGDWRLVPLGRGFFQMQFSSTEDKNRVWAAGSCLLSPGILRLQPWTPDFNPYRQKTTNTQLWVRFYDLSWEYWEIARGIGTPLKLDKNTLEGNFGHYAISFIREL